MESNRTDQKQGDVREIKRMVNASEIALGLQVNDLHQKTGNGLGRPRGKYNGVRLSEVRKAICYRIFECYPGLPLRTIGRFVGVNNHTSPLYSIRQARKHIEKKDDYFLHCYNKIIPIIK